MSEASRARSIRLEALGDPAAGIAFLETREHAEAQPGAFWLERVAGAALSDAAAQFVAEIGRDWVGTLTALLPEPGEQDYFGRIAVAGRALVVAVYVRPSQRGRGLLGALMEAAAGWARDGNATELALDVHQDNLRAQRAYTHLGFAPTGRFVNGPTGTELEMLRAL